MLNFSVIVAMDEARGIGRDGGLPWHLSGDLKHFREITASTVQQSRMNVVIMGRKTWASLPEKYRPLPRRINIVLTRDHGMVFPDGVFKADSLDAALDLAERVLPVEGRGEVFVIGGGDVFKQAAAHPSCQRLYLTQIHQTFDCDTFFPLIPADFKEMSRSADVSENAVAYHFADYERM